MMLIYSRHAADMLIERAIESAWVQRTVEEPDRDEPDPVHRERRRAFRGVPERGGRVLRVVYARSDDSIRIVTLFLDRGKRSS